LQFEAQAQSVIDALERYRTANNRYPRSLSQAGIGKDSQFGPWQYGAFEGGSAFQLGIGDYGSCLWQSTYTSKAKSWYHDS
jgi:hypothetical protein